MVQRAHIRLARALPSTMAFALTARGSLGRPYPGCRSLRSLTLGYKLSLLRRSRDGLQPSSTPPMGLILWKQSAAQHIVTVYRTAIKLFSYNKGWREDIAPAFIVIPAGIRALDPRLRRACSNPTGLQNYTAGKIKAFGANAQVFARISFNDRG